eukprot:COSAG01_NODE_206_length_22034_cov_125.512585_21_plen_92_part_00
MRLSLRPGGAGASGADGGAWCGELADVAPAGRGSDPTGGAACGAARTGTVAGRSLRRGHESRTGRRRGVMPRRRHGAARGEPRGKCAEART